MTPDRWQRVNEIFHAALDRDPAERETFVHDQTRDDPELLREVASLLESHRRSEGYLDLPAWAVGADLLTDDEPSLAGQTIGKYRVVREIARGGMGVVYLARDQLLDRAVALKSLPAEYSQDPSRRDRLAREARMAAQLEHRAIATIYELQEWEGQLFIVSEFVNGVTLRHELRDGPLPPAHLVGTLIEIAAALAAAHARNIIHRDLKPENIIRREDGQIKVLDFGLARRMTGSDLATSTRLTQPGIIAGTPGYMAPEVLNNAEADARSDIFVFGVVAWELATGKHPFGSHPNSQMARLHDISAGSEVDLKGPLATPGLEAVIRRCMRRLREDRYPTADALLVDLRKLQTHEAVATPPTSAPSQDLWWWRFHQRAMAVLVAATPVLSWTVRDWFGRPEGTWVFFLILALATVSVTLRLNLLFTSRVHASTVALHRARMFPWIAGSEAVLVVMLLVTAARISTDHEATAGLLILLGVVVAASLAVIEPETTRAAGLTRFRTPDSQLPPPKDRSADRL